MGSMKRRARTVGRGSSRPASSAVEAIEVEVESLAFGGDGVAHTPRALFIIGAAPGDRVRVRIREDRGTWARAEIVEMIAPSPARRAPPCPLAHACGGCQWQPIHEEIQREAKRRAVEDALRRIGGLRDVVVPPVLGIGPTLRYRRRTRFQVRARRSGAAIGFHRHRSHEVVDVDRCLQMSEGLARAYEAIREALDRRVPPGVYEVDLAVGSDDTGAVAALHVASKIDPGSLALLGSIARPLVDATALRGWAALDPGSRILDAWGDLTLEYVFPEGSVPGAPCALRQRGWAFSQVSWESNVALVRAVLSALGDPPPAHVLELYAGSGNFTLPLSALIPEVVAVEADPDAARELSDNLDLAGRRARVIAAPAAAALGALDRAGAVLLDPPREGAAEAIAGIVSLRPRRIVYVSCHPATLARDLARLAAGGYRLNAVQALDLFPQTYHVETVATCVAEDR
jgi:23S rRNA (uracil1939-C5)-methyltransferase